MGTLKYILQKEFIQVFRDKTILPIIFIMPVLQLIIFVYAATLEIKNVEILIVDKDNSSSSRELIEHFNASEFFKIIEISRDNRNLENYLNKSKVDIVLNIPSKYESDLNKGEAKVQLLANAINATNANLSYAYANSIIQSVNKQILLENFPGSSIINSGIQIDERYWYNPQLDYKIYMLPGILVILVTIIGLFLAAINLVREKEIGTIEQINVSPIKKYQFIIGKLLPFWIIGLFEIVFGLLIGYYHFNVPIEGSLLVLFGFSSIYLLVVLGIGLFISTISSSQQQVMFISFFFVMLFILMSGLFTPVESMPEWAKRINIINPLAYLMKVNRSVLLKASDFKDLTKEFIYISIYAVGILGLAVFRYRKKA